MPCARRSSCISASPADRPGHPATVGCGAALPDAGLFRSFWMGGYEGADHVNAAGVALDMVRATGHLQRLDEDYRRAARLGLRTLRESIGWRLCEDARGRLDLGRVHRIAEAATRAGIQPLWTLMHYGVPEGLTLLDDALPERFARFAAAVARCLVQRVPPPRVYTPVNEISFLAWAASGGGLMAPGVAPARAETPGDTAFSGYLIKRHLARAALAGMAAIRAEDPAARFLHVEPLVHVAAPPDAPAQAPLAAQIRSYQWQALDLLAGRLEPELGGGEEALDWLGFNHYHSSQWEAGTEQRLAWHLRDPRRVPLHQLLEEAWQRYRRPLLLAETGHVGMGRAAWLHEVAGEALRARARGVPLAGVCLYPLLDRPDWSPAQTPPEVDTAAAPRDPLSRWHRCGLWHLPDPGERPRAPSPAARHAVVPYVRALRAWSRLGTALHDATPPAPAGASEPPSRRDQLVVLLPGRWEQLEARLHALLLALAEGPGPGDPPPWAMRLVEPPGARGDPGLTRRHRLGPHLELMMLHGFGEAGWHLAPQALPRLRTALAEAWWSSPEAAVATATATEALTGDALPSPARRPRTLVWLMQGTPDCLDAAREAFQGASLAWQPAAGAPCRDDPPGVDLLLHDGPPGEIDAATAGAPACRRSARQVWLPQDLPPVALQVPPPGSYEAQEVRRLLGPEPRLRLLLAGHRGEPPAVATLQALSALSALSALRPAWQFVLLGTDAASADWPPACVVLPELAPELLPSLLQACHIGLLLGPTAKAEAAALRALARAGGLPIHACGPMGAPGQDLEEVRAIEALLDRPWPALSRRQRRRRARAWRAQLQGLREAVSAVLASGPMAPAPPARS